MLQTEQSGFFLGSRYLHPPLSTWRVKVCFNVNDFWHLGHVNMVIFDWSVSWTSRTCLSKFLLRVNVLLHKTQRWLAPLPTISSDWFWYWFWGKKVDKQLSLVCKWVCNLEFWLKCLLQSGHWKIFGEICIGPIRGFTSKFWMQPLFLVFLLAIWLSNLDFWLNDLSQSGHGNFFTGPHLCLNKQFVYLNFLPHETQESCHCSSLMWIFSDPTILIPGTWSPISNESSFSPDPADSLLSLISTSECRSSRISSLTTMLGSWQSTNSGSASCFWGILNLQEFKKWISISCLCLNTWWQLGHEEDFLNFSIPLKLFFFFHLIIVLLIGETVDFSFSGLWIPDDTPWKLKTSPSVCLVTFQLFIVLFVGETWCDFSFSGLWIPDDTPSATNSRLSALVSDLLSTISRSLLSSSTGSSFISIASSIATGSSFISIASSTETDSIWLIWSESSTFVFISK